MKAISLLEQIKAGFEKIIEANLIHRDMKPENVLIGDDGICKIGDFGFAARCDSQVK
jgi:serine/threonine-protein kinase